MKSIGKKPRLNFYTHNSANDWLYNSACGDVVAYAAEYYLLRSLNYTIHEIVYPLSLLSMNKIKENEANRSRNKVRLLCG